MFLQTYDFINGFYATVQEVLNLRVTYAANGFYPGGTQAVYFTNPPNNSPSWIDTKGYWQGQLLNKFVFNYLTLFLRLMTDITNEADEMRKTEWYQIYDNNVRCYLGDHDPR